MALIYQDLIAEMAPFSSGAGTFFAQGGLNIVRWCQRYEGRSPPDSPFLKCTFLGAEHTADLCW